MIQERDKKQNKKIYNNHNDGRSENFLSFFT